MRVKEPEGLQEVDRSEATFAGESGFNLHLTTWAPSRKRRAALVLAHGLGEHAGRYDHVARHFAARGVAFYGHDHQGHGQSGGSLGTVRRFTDFLADTGTVLARAREENPGLPAILLGHSMGGLIATAYVLECKPLPDLLVLSGPAILPLLEPGDRTIDATRLSRDPVEQQKYLDDPLVLRERVKPELFERLFDGLALLPGRASEIALPVLLVHGGDDRLCSAEGAESYLRGSSSKDLTIKIYEGARHEVFNDINRDEVIGDVWRWVESRIP